MVQLTIAEKVKILNYLDNGHSERDTAIHYKVSKGSVHNIKKNKQKILELYFIDYAWKSVTATCIRNCFATTGFISCEMDLDLNNNLSSEIEELIQTFTEIDSNNENLSAIELFLLTVACQSVMKIINLMR